LRLGGMTLTRRRGRVSLNGGTLCFLVSFASPLS
jgi:hypothetical protein